MKSRTCTTFFFITALAGLGCPHSACADTTPTGASSPTLRSMPAIGESGLLSRDPATFSGAFDKLAASVSQLRSHAMARQSQALLACSPTYGAPVGDGSSIGTFDGLHFNLGYTYGFSETYIPEAESRSWFLYFAPEAVYVGLQSALATYSAVDVFAARSLFIGGAKIDERIDPGKRLPWKRWAELMGIGFSWGGDISVKGFKIGTSHGISFFATESSYSDIQPVVQYSIGNQVSFDLMGALTPGFSVWPDAIADFIPSVSIDTRSNIPNKPRNQWGATETGNDTFFWPILDWCGVSDDSGQQPIDRLINRLAITASDRGSDFYGAYGREFANQLLPLFRKIKATAPDLLLNDPRMEQARQDVKQWREKGQAGAGEPPSKEMINRLLMLTSDFLPVTGSAEAAALSSTTQLGFKLANKRGYDNVGRTDTEHAACVLPVDCIVGQTCKVDITADELVALVPGSRASDFVNQELAIDYPPDEYLTTGRAGDYLRINNAGTASYSFTPRTLQRSLLGVSASRSVATQNRTLELCARSINAADGATAKTPPLSVNRTGSGKLTSTPSGIDCGNDCSEEYANGTKVTLLATPDPGFAFSGWSGDCSSATHACTVTLDAARNVTAAFTAPANSQLDCFFAWAEAQYPELLAPANPPSIAQGGYYYRHYGQTTAYLGMSVGGGRTYYLGPQSGNQLFDLGLTSEWLSRAGCSR